MTTTKTPPEALELRARPPHVVRLKRGVLIGVVGGVAALILGSTLWSLRARSPLLDLPAEPHQIEHVGHPEGLDHLPTDYSKVQPPKPSLGSAVPQLGPPMPGDLGTALLKAENARAERDVPGLSAVPLRPDPAADAARLERVARLREIDDAVKSGLFFHPTEQRARGDSTETASTAKALPESTSTHDSPREEPDEKRRFLRAQSDTSVSAHSLQSPSSPFVVSAGTVIPAALITGIDSDMPGQTLATVTEQVYDSGTGTRVLIPQGTRLIGEYDSQVGFGQRRVLLVWTRLIFPDASSLTLDRLAASDPAGHSGLADGVDRHWRELLTSAALSTLIGIGAELAAPDRSAGQGQVIVATRQSLQDSVNQVGQEVTRRAINVAPTLTIRPGYPLRVIVSKDLVLRPYQPLFVERGGR